MKQGMKFGTYALVAGLVLAMGAQTSLAASHKEGAKEEGFKSLFDGKTSAGWRGYRKEEFPKKGWVIAYGALHVIADGHGGDIITVDQYSDFDFRFEWKVAKGANSGVLYRVTEESEKSYESGLEYQILDNGKHRDGRHSITSAASIYDLYSPEGAETKPVGKWNEGRIVQKSNHVEHWLNGKKVVECEIGGEDWNERLAKSKFAGSKLFGKSQKGYIALQAHGDDVWFRNLRIEDLSK